MAVTATDSFERLYRLYRRDVYRFALSVVRNPVEAEDVTQTAFLNAFRAYARGERPERPHSWLIAIAHNAIRSRSRWTLRRPKEVSLEAAGEVAVAPSERSEALDVLRALGDLPPNQRDALAMRELEGRSYDEIARRLGVSDGAVESLISRARRALRRRSDLLRGLLLLPFRPGDEAGLGLAAKAAVVVAAAALTAGGASVESPTAGAAHPARTPLQRPQPRTDVLVQQPAPQAAARPAARPAAAVARTRPGPHAQAPHVTVPASPPPPARPVAPATPPPAAAPPVPATAPAAAPAAAPPAPATAPVAAPAAAPAPVSAVPAAAVTTTTAVVTAATATVAGVAPVATTPVATVSTPVVAVAVPSVTVSVPQLPPPPSVPQVSEVTGIK